MKKRKVNKILLLLVMVSIIISVLKINVKLLYADDNKVNIGDEIYLGKYQGKDIKWKCIGEDSNGKLMLSDTILCYKSYDARYSGYDNRLRKNFGSNYWQGSALRLWLNSFGKIDWSDRSEPSEDNIDGNEENHYEQEEGFLSSFTASELQCVKVKKQKTYLNEVDSIHKDGGVEEFNFNINSAYSDFFELLKDTDNKYYQNTEDYFFILGPEQFKMGCDNVGSNYMSLEDLYWLRLPCNTESASANVAMAVPKNVISWAFAADARIGVRAAFYLNEDHFQGEVNPGQKPDYFKIGKDSNQFVHRDMNYTIENEEYKKRLNDACDGFVSRWRLNSLLNGQSAGVCHGIALSMCYGDVGKINFNDIKKGANNYWTIGSPYENTKMKDLIMYYQATQVLKSGAPTKNVTKKGWGINNRLSSFLREFTEEAKYAENIRKPFVFSFGRTYGGKDIGHSIVVCGYQKKENGDHEIKFYDENSYDFGTPGDYLKMIISSDYQQFDFTDAIGMKIGEKLQDNWTSLCYYGINKLYNGEINVLKTRNILENQEVDNEKTVIQIPVNKKFRLENAEGKYLQYDGENYLGNMEIYDSYINDLENKPVWNLTVDVSESFELTKADNDCELLCNIGSKGYAVKADGAQKIKIESGKIKIKGNIYKLSVALRSKDSDDEIIKLEGVIKDNSTIIDDDRTTSIKFDGEGQNLKLTKFIDLSEIVIGEREEIKNASFVMEDIDKKNEENSSKDEADQDSTDIKHEPDVTTQTIKTSTQRNSKLKTQKIKISKIKNYRAKKLKNKKVSFNLKARAMGKAKLTYRVVKYPKKAKKYISVSKSGKVTLKKKIKKGVYKILITADRTEKYQKATKYVSIKIK